VTDSLSQRYTALEELGSGAFSTVYRVQDSVLGREMALKVMHPALLSEPTFVERFRQEARTVAGLRHPHIVVVYDYGEYDDRLCLAMDLLQGGSLADLLERGPLSWERALAITQQVAEALDYAHERDLVHRDVKPHNILLDEAGRAVLADFGVVRALESGTVASTMSGGVVGTAAYIPVEIWDGEPPSPRTDIYALACVVYEMVTGERLFQGSSLSNTIRRHLRPPEFPEEWPEGTPAGLQQVLTKALAQYPSRRHESAGAFAQDLAALPAGASEPAATGGGLPRWALPLGGLLFALLVLGGILLFGGGGGAEAPAVTVPAAAVTAATTVNLDAEEPLRTVEEEEARKTVQAVAPETAAPTAVPTSTPTLAPTVEEDATVATGEERGDEVGDAAEATRVAEVAVVAPALIAELEGHTDEIWSAAYSPDGERVVTAGEDGTARLWAADGSPIAVLEGHDNWVTSASFSPDGERVLTFGRDWTARLWDAETGASLTVLEGNMGWVESAAFSPDGTRLVVSGDDTPRVWNVEGSGSGDLIAVLEGHFNGVGAVAFSPDGEQIVTGSADLTARLWDAETGASLAVLEGHLSGVSFTAFSADGERLVTASGDGTARLWDVSGNGSGEPIAVLEGHTLPILAVAVSPDGERIVTGGFDRTARIWDGQTGALIAVLEGHGKLVSAVAFSPGGELLVTASGTGTILLWDAQGEPIDTIEGHTGWVNAVAFSPDGKRMVSAGCDGPVAGGQICSAGTARLWALYSD